MVRELYAADQDVRRFLSRAWLCSGAGGWRSGSRPARRGPTGHTTSVTIGGERFYLTANGHDDGSLGEVFIQWGKQGSTGAGLMDIYAVALSVGLQHGVPLIELITPGLDLYCVPDGPH